jgi:hypothetical protein
LTSSKNLGSTDRPPLVPIWSPPIFVSICLGDFEQIVKRSKFLLLHQNLRGPLVQGCGVPKNCFPSKICWCCFYTWCQSC